jgi:APA family basic amino acid/polyamine antiporter
MVGAGILTTSGYTLHDTGNPGALLALWLVGGIMALAGAVTVAELATAMPRVGGDYIYVREAFGREAGFVCGWATFVLGFAAPTAVVAHAAVAYLSTPHTTYLHDQLPDWLAPQMVRAGASLLIATVACVHCLGHRESGWLQVLATSVKLAILALLAIGGLCFGQGDWSYLAHSSLPSQDQWPVLAVGLVYVGYAYSGWNGAAYIAGEIRTPERLVPRCLILGTLTVVGLYLLVNLAYVYALDPVEMRQSDPDEVERVAELAAARLFGPRIADVLATLVGLSLIASASAYLLAGPRVTLAMARDGVFPRFAGHLHATRQTPALAILAQAGLAIVLVWSGTFLQLLDYTSVGLAAISGLMVASVFPLRRRGLPWPYRMPWYPLPPILYVALTITTIVFAVLQPDRQVPSLLSLATLLVAIPLARWFTRRRSAR